MFSGSFARNGRAEQDARATVVAGIEHKSELRGRAAHAATTCRPTPPVKVTVPAARRTNTSSATSR